MKNFLCFRRRMEYLLSLFRDVLPVSARNVRGNDLAARFGGEEFGVLLQDTSIEDAQAWAERFRNAIAESTLSCNNTVLTLYGQYWIGSLGRSPGFA